MPPRPKKNQQPINDRTPLLPQHHPPTRRLSLAASTTHWHRPNRYAHHRQLLLVLLAVMILIQGASRMVGLLARGNQRGFEEVDEFGPGSQAWNSLGNDMCKVYDYEYQGNINEVLELTGTVLNVVKGWLWWLVTSVAVFEGAG
ncbi:hypothetical protein BZA77DRAFT_355938 [Pyronema omphalodes]|nr:hypothetical protein BZA77DRAFT_355938 [Pyronema omphalodes]